MHFVRSDGTLDHLCYCSNIHAGERWDDVLANLRQFTPGIREALGVGSPFGIGLRLSGIAAGALDDPEAIAEFRAFLDEQNCYVFTLNGFPYGTFHGTRVKEDVYLPDWKDPLRLSYTNQLASVFARFQPDADVGSISTVPGAFKTEVRSEQDVLTMAAHMIEHVAHLVSLERTTGKRLLLALEPEPCCFLETIEETVVFFTRYLYSDTAARKLAAQLSVGAAEAHTLLRRHLTLCLDLCHAAVEFEDPDSCYRTLEAAGISIGKLQISSGLTLPEVTEQTLEALEPFIDSVYLHQVVERRSGQLHRYTDLPEAISAFRRDSGPREWRVHFHVPVFLDDLGPFRSTQAFIVDALQRHCKAPISRHLEVETYTWDVLPERYRTDAIEHAIVRELQWVGAQLGHS